MPGRNMTTKPMRATTVTLRAGIQLPAIQRATRMMMMARALTSKASTFVRAAASSLMPCRHSSEMGSGLMMVVRKNHRMGVMTMTSGTPTIIQSKKLMP